MIEIKYAGNNDLTVISELIYKVFKVRKPPEILRWILSSPPTQFSEINSIVALDEKEVFAHCGYITSRYILPDGSMIQGCHPILLGAIPRISPGIGRKLFSMAANNYDVSIIYEGTDQAIAIYPKSNYQKKYLVTCFRKVNNPSYVPRFTTIRVFIRSSLTIMSMISSKILTFLFNLIPSNNSHKSTSIYIPLDSHENNYYFNYPSEDFINWLGESPEHKLIELEVNHHHNINQKVLIYIGKNGNARIMHIPFLGVKYSKYIALVRFIENHLKPLNCNEVTIGSNNKMLIFVLRMAGYVSEGKRNIWVNDQKEILNNLNAHLTFIEGDQSFRGV